MKGVPPIGGVKYALRKRLDRMCLLPPNQHAGPLQLADLAGRQRAKWKAAQHRAIATVSQILEAASSIGCDKLNSPLTTER